jgi:hypothetical protein
MCAVNGNALLTITMISACLLTGAMIFVLIFLPEFRRKFFLKAESFRTISFMELLHGNDFLWILFDYHMYSPL